MTLRLAYSVALLAILSSFTIARSGEKDRPNILLICVDDLRPELKCFGKDYIHSPNIDALSASGLTFTRHYVQAPTCGASRYALLTGRYGPASNGALFQRAKRLSSDSVAVPPSMPAWFRQCGYSTVSVGKVSHHPGGRGGPDWDQSSEPEMPASWDRHLMPVGDWEHPRGAMHGLAHGEIRKNAREMDVMQSVDGGDEIYPDGLTLNTALEQLSQLAKGDKPFFLAVGIIRPHLPFGAPASYMSHYKDVVLPTIKHPVKPAGKTTWHKSGEFMKYNRWGRDPNTDADFAIAVRRHYAACVSYADAQVGRLIDELEQLGESENTIVVLWGDHGWHLGEHAIWGKHALFEESLHSPLIIRDPRQSKAVKRIDTVVETIDVFPTLCEMTGSPVPSFVHGSSLGSASQPKSTETAVSYKGGAATIRTSTHRLILHDGGHVELYDHRTEEAETENVANQNAGLVDELTAKLKERLALKK